MDFNVKYQLKYVMVKFQAIMSKYHVDFNASILKFNLTQELA